MPTDTATGTSDYNRRHFYSLYRPLDHISTTYENLALISDLSHFEDFKQHASETIFCNTLFVSSSWLLWQDLLYQNQHCIHMESRSTHVAISSWRDDLDLRANDWIYINGKDQTVFDDVSLGRKCETKTRLVLLELTKLKTCLEYFISNFKIKTVYFYDFRIEGSILDGKIQLYTVKNICRKFKKQFLNRLAPIQNSSIYNSRATLHSNHRLKPSYFSCLFNFTKKLFFSTVIQASRLNLLHKSDQTRIFILSTALTSTPLLKSIKNINALPIVFAEWFPHKHDIRFLLKCLMQGVVLTKNQKVELTANDLKKISSIKTKALGGLDACGDEINQGLNKYIKDQIINSDLITQIALEVKRSDAILKHEKPDQCFTDSQMNPLVMTFFELANLKNIYTNQTWHGFYLHDLKVTSLGSDPRVSASINRVLTWGKAHEDWLDTINATVQKKRIGDMVPACHTVNNVPVKKLRNILVLQYAYPGIDPTWPQAGEYEYFINTIRMLNDLGFSNINFKLHPGPYKQSYYETIAKNYNLKCIITKEGPFQDCIDWADAVIGPAHSGSLLEVLASKKIYYAMLLSPNKANIKYLKGYPVYKDTETLRSAIHNNISPDFSTARNHLTSLDDIKNPPLEAWKILISDS